MESTDFAWALRQMLAGKKIARTGWNGKGMFLVYQPGYPTGIPVNKNTATAFGVPEGVTMNFQPYIAFYTDSGTVVPWTASQTDLLNTDWTVVDNPTVQFKGTTTETRATMS